MPVYSNSEARGRNLIYRADFGRMNDLLAYLTEHCCQGQALPTRRSKLYELLSPDCFSSFY